MCPMGDTRSKLSYRPFLLDDCEYVLVNYVVEFASESKLLIPKSRKLTYS
jgi:hypothetical protein